MFTPNTTPNEATRVSASAVKGETCAVLTVPLAVFVFAVVAFDVAVVAEVAVLVGFSVFIGYLLFLVQ